MATLSVFTLYLRGLAQVEHILNSCLFGAITTHGVLRDNRKRLPTLNND